MNFDLAKYKRPVNHIEYNSKISSKYVSHFTPKFDTLLRIIDTGFMPSECNEFQIYKQDYLELEVLKNWYSSLAGSDDKINEFIHKVPMSCFCDIPHKFTSKHRHKYGKYYISLTKKWAISKGLSPLIYVPKDSKLHFILKSINSLKDRLIKLNADYEIPEIIQMNQQLELLFEYIKPYINKQKDYKYYDEREWRYTPPINIHYNPSDTDQYLKFDKGDFLFAIVQNAMEKNILIDKLREKFGYISTKRVKIKKI